MTRKAKKKVGVNGAEVARGEQKEVRGQRSEVRGQESEKVTINGHNGHGFVEGNGKPLNGHSVPVVNGKSHSLTPALSQGEREKRALTLALSQGEREQRALAPALSQGEREKPGRAIARDMVLVERCLGGEPAAWSQMYQRFHGPLLASIRGFLGRIGQNFHLVDEISARVWYALVRNHFELLGKFDPSRGCRLTTFLSVLAKAEARLLLRSERRRKTREHVASRSEIEEPPAGGGDVLSDDEFIDTLSPAERTFYLDILIATCGTNGIQYTQQNQWQLRHRVRKKLEQFLE